MSILVLSFCSSVLAQAAESGTSAKSMPFLHGFRRIIYEYQPLVDAVLCVVGLEEGTSTGERSRSPEDEDSLCGSLVELLEKESQSAVFEEGISYALFKVAERGLVCAAEVLLRYGADLNFEDPVSYYNPLHIAVLRNRPIMVRLLAGHGADINKRDRIHESSPLDLASEEAERLPCMRTLLDMGADVNARDKNGKSPLLHALASSDGLTVHNTENIRLLLQRGADVHAATLDGETAVSSLVFLVKEALEGSVEDAAEIGRFCLKATRLLLAHGADPSCCLTPDGEEDGEPSLTVTSLEHFDRLFPLAVLLLQSGASFHCSRHGASCWTGYRLVFQRLQTALLDCSDAEQVAELLEQAEVLLDLARVSSPSLALPLDLPMPDQDPNAQTLRDLHRRVVEQETGPPPLRCLCRAFIRGHLQPWPLDDRVKALPLPDRLKGYLLPEHTLSPKPGWDCFKPQRTLR
ncbi:ankyrin repeat and SOCS box protein 6 isoform X1 [Salmo salar]|uniref:Ankyrin repeat and SOCS box protein 6 isoform X1 n=2 Tax=Salmo salar TaxID=8030 RepID=A0A1S3PI64_SALSA|nr:ankyrin repeat and SOCS box protein 6 isoform X1 [Salmo salar]|eukprot:XP_014027322.1 PREDICTED: ankyrin repeat and SOCS box protein 6 isoform X1 [Salmo salar]